MNKKAHNHWPDDFNLDDTPAEAARIRAFIELHLAELRALDAHRAIWVKDNLPEDYEMTYFFYDHTLRVAEDMKRTALYLGLSENTAENLYWVMLAHDVGKVCLPVSLWDMVEKPEDAIKAQRRTHTQLGVEMVEEELSDMPDHPFVKLMLDIMAHHHENMDSSGFLGLTGDQLSAPVRLACIVESYDGYRIARPHFGDRDVSPEGVLARMREEKGAAIYDMELLDAFTKAKLAE